MKMRPNIIKVTVLPNTLVIAKGRTTRATSFACLEIRNKFKVIEIKIVCVIDIVVSRYN